MKQNSCEVSAMKELDFALIGQKIKEVRTSKKLTQEYLANATGVNVSHISNIETNKVKVSLTLLVQICNALDTTVDYILDNEYHRPTTTLEKELLNMVKDMEKEKQDILLRIARVL
jgi:transcriptional regulator with XRE-family HTH domain